MRLRERARLGAALARGALIRFLCKLRLDLPDLLPDEIQHETRAWREMPSRRIDQVEWNAGRGKAAQDANQRAVAEVVEHFDQGEIGDAVSGAGGQVHRTHVV